MWWPGTHSQSAYSYLQARVHTSSFRGQFHEMYTLLVSILISSGKGSHELFPWGTFTKCTSTHSQSVYSSHQARVVTSSFLGGTFTKCTRCFAASSYLQARVVTTGGAFTKYTLKINRRLCRCLCVLCCAVLQSGVMCCTEMCCAVFCVLSNAALCCDAAV